MKWGKEGGWGILRIPDDAPHASLEQGLISLLVLLELPIRQRLQRESGPEQPHSQHLNIRMIPSHDRAAMPERRRKRQRNHSLEQGFGQEHLDQGLIPEALFLLHGFIFRVVLTPRGGPRSCGV